MARTPRRTAAALLLLGPALPIGTGLVLGTAPPAQAAPVAKWSPYGHGGMLVRLPGGGQLRLVLPSGQPTASGPAADPAPGPTRTPDPGPTPTPPSPSAGAGGGGGGATPSSAPSGGPSAAAATPSALPVGVPVAVSELPIPLLDPVYPTPSVSARQPPAADSAGGSSRQSRQQDWMPLGDGPPPLGPQALAVRPDGPTSLSGVGSGAVPGAGTETQAARWEQKERLLPLGVGLALIGSGAALFGWRLRRP